MAPCILSLLVVTSSVLGFSSRLHPADTQQIARYRASSSEPFGFVFSGWLTAAQPLTLMSAAQWDSSLLKMIHATHSSWVQIQVALYQPHVHRPSVDYGPLTPSTRQLRQEIAFAHQQGLKVAVTPTLLVGDASYSGDVAYPSLPQAQQWFHSYWRRWAPYAGAAQAAHANALGVASEMVGLQAAPSSLWEALIAEIHRQFSGPLWVDLNWNAVQQWEPWMRSPLLTAIGIDAYFPIESSPHAPTPSAMMNHWIHAINPLILGLHHYSGHSIVVSEIGYKNSTNALTHPYSHTTSYPPDPVLQNQALVTGIKATTQTHAIAGVFVFGWNVGYFSPSSLTTHVWWETGFVTRRVETCLKGYPGPCS